MIVSKPLGRMCSALSRLVDGDRSRIVEAVARLAENAAGLSAREREFLSFFAAVQCAWRSDVAHARSLLDRIRSNPLATELNSYLKRLPFPAPYSELFASPGPLKTWERLPFNAEFNANCLECVSGRHISAPSRGIPYVMDVGTGDGGFLVRIIQALKTRNNLTRFGVILIEKSPELLAKAVSRIARLRPVGLCDIVSFCERVENLTDHERNEIARLSPVFVVGAASVHHLNAGNKRAFFQWIRTLNCDLMIFELEGNEEYKNNRSPAFIFSVFTLYTELLGSLFRSRFSTREKSRCSKELVFAEALDLLSQPYTSRQNHHAPAGRWRDHAKCGGFDLVSTKVMTIGDTSVKQIILDCRIRP